jgi:hypothetical protein
LHVVRAVERDQPDLRNRRNKEPKVVVEPEIIDVSSAEDPYGPPRPSAEEMQAVMELAATMTPQERQEFFEYIRSQNFQDFEESLLEDDLEGNLTAMRAAFGDQVDTPEFWESAVWDPLVLDTLRSQLSMREVALMDRLMGHDWERVGALDEGDLLQQLQTMAPAEQELLLGILQKLQMLKVQMEMSGLAGGVSGMDAASSSGMSSTYPGSEVIVDTTATSTSNSSSSSSSSSNTYESASSSSNSSSEIRNQASAAGGGNMSRVKRWAQSGSMKHGIIRRMALCWAIATFPALLALLCTNAAYGSPSALPVYILSIICSWDCSPD